MTKVLVNDNNKIVSRGGKLFSNTPPTTQTYSLLGNASLGGDMIASPLPNPWLNFDSSKWLTNSNITQAGAGTITVGMWFNLNNLTTQQTIFHAETGTIGNGITFGRRIQVAVQTNGSFFLSYRGSHSNFLGTYQSPSGVISSEVWNHIWVVFPYNAEYGPEPYPRIYLDGSLVGVGNVNVGGSLNTNDPTYWGRTKSNSQHVNGIMSNGIILNTGVLSTAAPDAIFTQGHLVKQSEIPEILEVDVVDEWYVT